MGGKKEVLGYTGKKKVSKKKKAVKKEADFKKDEDKD